MREEILTYNVTFDQENGVLIAKAPKFPEIEAYGLGIGNAMFCLSNKIRNHLKEVACYPESDKENDPLLKEGERSFIYIPLPLDDDKDKFSHDCIFCKTKPKDYNIVYNIPTEWTFKESEDGTEWTNSSGEITKGDFVAEPIDHPKFPAFFHSQDLKNQNSDYYFNQISNGENVEEEMK